MPDESQNHGLQIYSIGEEGWTHTPDIETLEERVPVAFDIEENLGEYQPYQGAQFIDTETGKTFDGDGNAWNHAERDFAGLAIDGDAVATETYVDDEIAAADTGGTMTTHGNDYHDPDFATTTDLDSHETAETGVHGAGSSGLASNSDVDAAISDHAQLTDVHGLPGGTIANESYVDTTVDDEISLHAGVVDAHHAKYTNDEARAAVDGSDVSVSFWDGYELVFDDETPDTNQYIRIETQ